MRVNLRSLMLVLGVFAATSLGGPAGEARAGDYSMEGFVFFTNVKNATTKGSLVPYIGYGNSPLLGPHYQSGAILNTTGLTPVDATTFTFEGVVGPNPYLPNHPKIHLITTANGEVFCTWTAKFTVKIIDAHGTAILSGDGKFTVTGGTGPYYKSTGNFETLFQTTPVPHGSNDADATVTENGNIKKK